MKTLEQEDGTGNRSTRHACSKASHHKYHVSISIRAGVGMNSLSSLKRLRLARCYLLILLLRLHIDALELRQTFLTDEATVMRSYA